jgi:hypothetical protein
MFSTLVVGHCCSTPFVVVTSKPVPVGTLVRCNYCQAPYEFNGTERRG